MGACVHEPWVRCCIPPQMFHTRYSLFKQIYLHKATKAIEYMITDALAEAGMANHVVVVATSHCTKCALL